ncbi:LOW QUALITY PROTEIN: kinesin-like protein KIF28P [Dugong dugon]
MMKMPVPSIDSVEVAVRVRLFSQREKNSGSKCVISMHSRTTTTIQDPKNPERMKIFTFDLAYWSHNGFQRDKDGVLISADPSSKFAGQRDVFHNLGRGILDNACQGYNATLLAYGQTGSGKSYSLIGFGANKGIVPNAREELFQAIENREKNQEYQVTISMLEIYNEEVRDLLSRTKKPGGLKSKEDQQLGFYVDGLKSVPESYAQIERLMEQGTKIRTTASTNMNASSSRSHMVITIQFKQLRFRDLTKQSSINLVDLAGSERQKSSGSEGDRLREGSRLSLTSLGNVISALADAAMGKKVLHIPYRDSILTKLLQSALGGNSRTILLTSISPADIRCEETLSTLRYAERYVYERLFSTVVLSSKPANSSSAPAFESTPSHDKLMYNRTKRCQVLHQPAMFEFIFVTVVPVHLTEGLPCPHWLYWTKHDVLLRSKAKQPAYFLAENQCGTPTTQMSWAHQLDQAQEEWGQLFMAIAQVSLTPSSWRLTTTSQQPPAHPDTHCSLSCCQVDHSVVDDEDLPHLLNVSEDPQLTRVLKYFIHTGSCDAGQAASNTITLQGLGILDKHASFTNLDVKVTVTPYSKCKVVVNGVPITTKTKLHLALSLLQSGLFQPFTDVVLDKGISALHVAKSSSTNSGDRKADPSVLAVFQDYIKLMPLTAEANQMSEELTKGVKMELKVKNLVSSDSRGYDLQKEVMVKVTSQRTHEVWIWSKAKFISRKFLMEELQRFLDGGDSHMAQDPVEVVHLGSAHIWLQSLAYCMKFEKQVEFLNCDGLEEAVLHIHITPCLATGQAHGEEDVVIDPLELLGKRIDFQIHIVQCLGVKWLKEDANRGIQVGYRVYDLPNTLYTKPVWKIVNPQIEETVQSAALNASQEFLNYLQTLIVDLWGLQEGCAELSCSPQDLMVTGEGHIMVDTKKTSTAMGTGQTTSNQVSELYLKLLKLEQEVELFRNINRALREENVLLKESLVKTGSGQQGERLLKSWLFSLPLNSYIWEVSHKPSSTLKITGMAAQSPSAKDIYQMCAQRASYDGELAKALKVFYQSMNMARRQFLRLGHYMPPIIGEKSPATSLDAEKACAKSEHLTTIKSLSKPGIKWTFLNLIMDDDQMLRPFIHQRSQMLKDFGDLLESSLWKLKNDVARIVKNKRECLLHIK